MSISATAELKVPKVLAYLLGTIAAPDATALATSNSSPEFQLLSTRWTGAVSAQEGWKWKAVRTSSSSQAVSLHLRDETDADVLTFSRSTKAATFAGAVITPASATGGAGFHLTPGVAPTSPSNGNVWLTSGGIFARVNGVTLTLGGALTYAGLPTGSGSWDVGAGNTLTFTRAVSLSSTLTAVGVVTFEASEVVMGYTNTADQTIRRNVTSSVLRLAGGTAADYGANIRLGGSAHSGLGSAIAFMRHNTEDGRMTDGRLLWGCSITTGAGAKAIVIDNSVRGGGLYGTHADGLSNTYPLVRFGAGVTTFGGGGTNMIIEVFDSLKITGIPTADPGVPGGVWRSGTDLMISV